MPIFVKNLFNFKMFIGVSGNNSGIVIRSGYILVVRK